MDWTFTTLKDWLSQWVPSSPAPASSSATLSRLNLADELATRGKLTEAVGIYASIIREHPDEILTYVNCGSMCVEHRQFDAAEGILRAGLEKAPTSTHLWANLSSALSGLNRHEEALDAANKAVLYDDTNAMAYYNRGECWAAVNQMIFSIRDLETANRLDPGNDEIARKLRLSRIAIASPMEQYADAQYEPKAHGYEFVDGVEVRATLQCPHCGTHFPSIKGSKIQRGWCSGCFEITCGKLACRECVPFQKKLELLNQANALITS